MKNLTFGVVTFILLTGSSAIAQDRYEGLPYRQNYRQEMRGPVYWSRGDRLPRHYLGGEFLVKDYWGNNLNRPPRGHYWVRVSNQFILVASASGLIRQVIRIEDRRERDWGGPDRAIRTPECPDRGPPPRLYDRADQEARWRQRYWRTYTLNDDAYYSECRNKSDPAGVLLGAVLGGLLGNAAGGRGDNTAETFAGVVAGGALGAMLSKNLDCEDRSYAYRTYSDGFNAGRPNATYQWNNSRNNRRGELHVEDYYDDPDGFRCAKYTQRIYIDGRPQEATGRACRQPDGAWAIID